MSKIIAVDFDGTLFTNAWPEIGDPIMATISALIKEQAAGARIILWTNRTGDRLDEAIRACASEGIFFNAVNENLPDLIDAFGGDCRKVFANEYWDDRAVVATDNGMAMPDPRQVEICDRALDVYGPAPQIIVCCEELSELAKELCKSLRGQVDVNHIAEEIADVEITVQQMRLLFDCDRASAAWKDKKLHRLVERMEAENGKDESSD